MNKSPDAKIKLLIGIVLVILTAIAYCQVLKCGYVKYDDPDYIQKNYHIANGLSKDSISWAFTTGRAANWHPVTWLSYMIDIQAFGRHAWIFHLTNLLFHIANALLLFLLLARITKKIWPSAFVAALFALHPLHVESVAWVSERKDVLSTFFMLITIWAYVFYIYKPAFRRYLLVMAVFALGLMSKPMLVTLPFVLLMLDYWPLQRSAGKRSAWRYLVIEKLPLMAMAVASCVITVIAQHNGGAVQSVEEYPYNIRIPNAVVSYVMYIRKMFWPSDLCILYPHPGASLPLFLVLISAALMIAITIPALRCARKYPYITVGWLWYMVMLVPVVGILQVGQQAMADRYTYMPIVGLFIIIAWSASDLLERFGPGKLRYFLAAVAGIVIALVMALTYTQVCTWRNSKTLYNQALKATSGHYIIRYCVAEMYAEEGKTHLAMNELKKALKKNPNYAQGYDGMGLIYQRQGKMKEALREFNHALEINPNLELTHNSLGTALALEGRVGEAISHYKRAIELKPYYADTHYSLANAYIRLQKNDEAIAEYREAIRLDPEMAIAHSKLGFMLIKQGEYDEAEEHLTKAIEIDPKLVEAHFFLGFIRQINGDIQGAYDELTEAIRLKPDFAPAHNGLAMVLLQMRDYDGARREVEIAKSLGYPVEPELVKMLFKK